MKAPLTRSDFRVAEWYATHVSKHCSHLTIVQVSASGDGKMILWDIESGERLRTFEGHDRGLACIEFKVNIFDKRSTESH